MPVFAGGFAAVEAEYVFRLGAMRRPTSSTGPTTRRRRWSAALHVGVEPASSPLATINDLGPAVVVSDFGNNAGLMLGPEIADWRQRVREG